MVTLSSSILSTVNNGRLLTMNLFLSTTGTTARQSYSPQSGGKLIRFTRFSELKAH